MEGHQRHDRTVVVPVHDAAQLLQPPPEVAGVPGQCPDPLHPAAVHDLVHRRYHLLRHGRGEAGRVGTCMGGVFMLEAHYTD